MSGFRTIESLALAGAILVGGTACTKDRPVYGPKVPTPMMTPVTTAESGGTLFEQVSCNKGEITFAKPMGWSILEVPVTPNLINCYASKGSLTREENFRSGLRISKLTVPISSQERIDYARQLASKPDGQGLFPVAETFSETRKGTSSIFSGRFVGNSHNIYSEEGRKIIVQDGSNVIYIIAFTAPKPTADEDFRRYGRYMLDTVQIKAVPNA